MTFASQMPMATATTDSPEPILNLAMGFMASKHLFVANAVGLFERLADGPTDLDELAARCGLARHTLRIVADAMVALGLVDYDGERYENSALAATHLSGRHAETDLRPLLRLWDRITYPGWEQFEEAVRSGARPTRRGQFSPEEQRIFSEGIEAMTRPAAQALASAYPFADHRRILALGGGTWSFLLAIVRAHPHLRGTVLELPGAAMVVRRGLANDAGASLIQIIAGDFSSQPLPGEHDALLVVNVAHLFSPEQNCALLRRAREAVAPGARVLLVDFWTDLTHTQPIAAAVLSGTFLLTGGQGQVSSTHDGRGWLAASGWRTLDWSPLVGAASLLVGEAI